MSETGERGVGGSPWGRARKAVMICAGVIGVVGVVLGCWLPQIVVYLLGVGVLALVAIMVSNRLIARRWVRTLASGSAWTTHVLAALLVGVVIVGLGVLIPRVAAALTNRDMSWHRDITARYPVAVHGQVYLSGQDGKIRVVDQKTGSELWSVAGSDFSVSEAGTLFTYQHADAQTGPVAGAFQRDGKPMWGAETREHFDRPVVLAATAHTTVIGACGTYEAGLPEDCRVAGLDASGQVQWEHQIHKPEALQLEESLHVRAVLGERGWVLPTTAALLKRTGRNAAQAVAIDPDSGRQVTLGGSKRAEDLYAVGDTVLVSHTGHQVCEWSAYRNEKRLWSQKDRALCRHTPVDDGYPASAVRLFDDRAYLLKETRGHRLATLDLKNGDARVLEPEKASAPDDVQNAQLAGDAQEERLAGASVILSIRGHQLIGTDPATGQRLWKRPAGATGVEDTSVSHALLVRGPVDVPNPFLGPMPHVDDDLGGLSWTRDHRMTLVDPKTGKNSASVVAHDSDFWPNHSRRDLSDALSAIVSSSDGGVYRLDAE